MVLSNDEANILNYMLAPPATRILLGTIIQQAQTDIATLQSILAAMDGNGEIELSMLATGTLNQVIVAGTDGVPEWGLITEDNITPESIGVDSLDTNSKTIVIRFDNAVVESLNTDVWEKIIGTVPFAGNITAVKYTPNAALGQDINTAALTLYNRKDDDTGTAAVASKNFTAANAVAARISAELPVSGVPIDVAVEAGDVLTLAKTNAAGDAQIVPAGVLEVTIVRTA